ncbi:MAG: hypothetical protein WBQ59_19150, partial [Candidatus Acidiferrum sp.]
VDSVALTVTQGASLLSSLTPLFEAGLLQPSTIAKRGSLDDALQLYSHVAAGKAGKAVFALPATS